MSGITIGIKKPGFPEWVEEIYNKMTPEDRELNTKSNIYGSCSKTEDGFKILDFISALSNRVTVLPDAQSVAVAIALADGIYPWTYLPGDSIKPYTCKHCQHKFESRGKDPRCESCGKYSWQEIEPAKAEKKEKPSAREKGK